MRQHEQRICGLIVRDGSLTLTSRLNIDAQSITPSHLVRHQQKHTSTTIKSYNVYCLRMSILEEFAIHSSAGFGGPSQLGH